MRRDSIGGSITDGKGGTVAATSESGLGKTAEACKASILRTQNPGVKWTLKTSRVEQINSLSKCTEALLLLLSLFQTKGCSCSSLMALRSPPHTDSTCRSCGNLSLSIVSPRLIEVTCSCAFTVTFLLYEVVAIVVVAVVCTS